MNQSRVRDFNEMNKYSLLSFLKTDVENEKAAEGRIIQLALRFSSFTLVAFPATFAIHFQISSLLSLNILS